MSRFRIPIIYLKHMRVPFQLTLAPLFFWGLFLSGAELGFGVITAFVSLHLCLYPGVTAFNSAYDRDTGPVSGMMNPPEVPRGLLTFSLALQTVGAILAAAVGLSFLSIYALIAVLAAAYSHPTTRWKASPWGSAATVAIGQGVLGFAAGWSAASGGLPPMQEEQVLLGAVTAGFTTLGLYPSTQVFQVEEDRARGDQTLAVVLGPVRALRFGSLCLAAAGASAIWLMSRKFALADALVIAAAFGAVVTHNEIFASRMAGASLDLEATYRWAMRTSTVSTGGFLLFMVLQFSST